MNATSWPTMQLAPASGRILRHLGLAALLVLTAILPLFAQPSPAPNNMQLFLLIGQSNMAGRGKIEPQDQVEDPHIFMLTRDRQWTPAKDPVHYDKPIAGVGLAMTFARVLATAEPGVTIGLIPCAVGGTSLDQWKPGGALYREAVERAREAMKHGKLAGILWHQGEADSAHDKVSTYGTRFSAMIQELRAELEASDVPVIIGELGHFRPASEEFNRMLPVVASQVRKCRMVSSDGLKDGGDALHFDAASCRILGERYAAAYQKFPKP